jgi:cytochrome c biogenesis protein CcmG/thiol:disulfide interchange protein DsbE
MRLFVVVLVLIAAAGVIVYVAVTKTSIPRVGGPSLPPPRIRTVTSPVEIVTTGLRVGSRAPSFRAPRFDGGVLSLEDLRGMGVVMNFWASWCPPCRAEARDLDATSRKYRDRGIVFLGVDIEQDTWDDAREFLREYGISYTTIRDEPGEIARQYQLYGLPTTYFIDKDGVIRSKYVGPFLGPEGLKVLETRIGMILP